VPLPERCFVPSPDVALLLNALLDRWERREATRPALAEARAVRVVKVVVSELGPDLSAFPTERHFVSYLKLSPKLAISGGKPIRKHPKGTASTRVGAALRMAALTLRNSKTALGGAYRRLARRKGPSVAVFAIARKLATLIYRMLRYGTAYVDEGLQVYEQRFQDAKLRMCKQIADQFGYKLIQQEKI